jgi:hypothetical protein
MLKHTWLATQDTTDHSYDLNQLTQLLYKQPHECLEEEEEDCLVIIDNKYF